MISSSHFILFHYAIVLCQGYKETKLLVDNTFASQVTGCQVRDIEKATRPLFADWVTY